MKKYEIIFGTQYDKNGDHIEFNPDDVMAFNDILSEVALHFGGFSLNDGQGGYVYADGELRVESSKTLTVIAEVTSINKINIYKTVENIKYLFDQESVLLIETEIEYKFI